MNKQPCQPDLIWGRQYSYPVVYRDLDVICSQKGSICLAGDRYSDDWSAETALVIEFSSQSGTVKRVLPDHEKLDSMLATADSKGNIYTAGCVPNDGGSGVQVVLHGFSPAGRLMWRKKYNTNNAYGFTDLLTDGRSLYLTGSYSDDQSTYLLYVMKIACNGNLVWEKPLRFNRNKAFISCIASGLDVHGNVFIASDAHEIGAEPNLSIAKIDPDGKPLWIKDCGFKGYYITGIQIDNKGSIYVAGSMRSSRRSDFLHSLCDKWSSRQYTGPLSSYKLSGFIVKLDSNAKQEWFRRTSTGVYDAVYDLALDTKGNIYTCGITITDAYARKSRYPDAMVAKFDASGTKVWQRRMGTLEDDQAFGVSVDSNTDVYVCGITRGNLYCKNKGGGEIFLTRMKQ